MKAKEITGKRKSTLLKSATVYTIGGVASQSVPFILLPILTRYLTPEDYGLVTIFQAVLVVTIPFVGVNITNAITRSYYDLKEADMAIYIGNCMIILTVSFFIVFLIFGVFNQALSYFTELPAVWLLIVPIVAAGKFLFNTILSVWRVKRKAVAFTTYNIALTVVNFSISILLVVMLAMDWKGRIIGISISHVLFGAVGFSILFSQGYIKFVKNKEYIKDALKMGLPLIPHSLGVWAKNMSNRLFLNRLVGLNATGLFSVGYNFGSIIALFQGAFHQAWIPWLYTKLKQGSPEEKLRIVKFTYLYNICSIIAALILAKISHWILPWFLGEKFTGASVYITWITLGMAADGMYKMVVGYIYYAKKTYLLVWVTLFTGLLSVLLNYLLIKKNGPIGAAQAMVVTFYVTYILTWFLANKAYPMPWSLRLKES